MANFDTTGWLHPDWSIPGVQGFVSLRSGTTATDPWGDFNTADHVGDDPGHVAACREQLCRMPGQTHPPLWIDQVHGIAVAHAVPGTPRQVADAVYTRTPGLPVTIHTADCLPVFFASTHGDEIALAHAGWRGLLAGVIAATVQAFQCPGDQIRVWLGPAIGPHAFEVGDDVRAAFVAADARHADAFRIGQERAGRQHWWCDIYRLARQQLTSLGIESVTGGECCTVTDGRFFSYRRDVTTGRMLSVLWIDATR